MLRRATIHYTLYYKLQDLRTVPVRRPTSTAVLDLVDPTLVELDFGTKKKVYSSITHDYCCSRSSFRPRSSTARVVSYRVVKRPKNA